MSNPYTPNYDQSGNFAGVTMAATGASVPNDPRNRDYIAFLAWNAANGNPINTSGTTAVYVPRNLLDIYSDLVGLTATQKANIWNDLSSGTPAKYLVNDNDSGIAALDWAVRYSGLPTAAITDAKIRITALYVRNVDSSYLVTPAFDATINVPGQVAV